MAGDKLLCVPIVHDLLQTYALEAGLETLLSCYSPMVMRSPTTLNAFMHG